MSRPARRGRRGHDEEEAHDGERWLLTYADMITLLMVLFIVMFAISQVDRNKFSKLQEGLAKEFGARSMVIPGGSGVLDAGKTPAQHTDVNAPIPQVLDQLGKTEAARIELSRLEDAKERIFEALREHGLEKSVRLDINQRGLVVTIVTDEVLFETGKADLRPLGAEVLDAVGPVLVDLPNRISVEGHTDNVPIRSARFASNWELSAERATTVLRYTMERHGITPSRLSAAGFADTQPLAGNDSADGRSRNRRVEIVILSSITQSQLNPQLLTTNGRS
jgi:chemotaxis protein MotB